MICVVEIFFFIKGMSELEIGDFSVLVFGVLFRVKDRFKDVRRKVMEVFVNIVLLIFDCFLFM